MLKLDFKTSFKELYNPPVKEPVIVDVPPVNFLMLDGEGDPNTSLEYQEAVSTLYNVAYTLKFMLKKGPEALDYSVAPLEGLWWCDNMAEFSTDNKQDWKWTMMIMQPEQVTAEHVARALEEVRKKKGPANLSKVRFERFEEGLCAQIMHIGPYSAEAPNIQKVHAFARDNGYRLRDKHHEIYLGDPRRSAPEKLKTIIRQPIGKQ